MLEKVFVPRLVPLDVLATAPLEDATKTMLAQDATVQLGSTLEVDLVLAERTVAGSASVLRQWLTQCREHWSQRRAGITTERRIYYAQQRDSKDARVDLHEIVAALEGSPELAPMAAVLDKTPNWAALAEQGTLTRDTNKATWSVNIPLKDYPEQLGGAMVLGETSRRLTFSVSHAKWRDRRSRRLLAIAVDVEQTWPEGAQVHQPTPPS